MTVDVGAGDARRAIRVHAGRTLIRLSRHLSRAGAHLLGHPSARSERLVERAPLQVVRDAGRWGA